MSSDTPGAAPSAGPRAAVAGPAAPAARRGSRPGARPRRTRPPATGMGAGPRVRPGPSGQPRWDAARDAAAAGRRPLAPPHGARTPPPSPRPVGHPRPAGGLGSRPRHAGCPAGPAPWNPQPAQSATAA